MRPGPRPAGWPGGDGDVGDRFGRAVDEPRDVRVDEVAVDGHTRGAWTWSVSQVVAPGRGAWRTRRRPGGLGASPANASTGGSPPGRITGSEHHPMKQSSPPGTATHPGGKPQDDTTPGRRPAGPGTHKDRPRSPAVRVNQPCEPAGHHTRHHPQNPSGDTWCVPSRRAGHSHRMAGRSHPRASSHPPDRDEITNSPTDKGRSRFRTHAPHGQSDENPPDNHTGPTRPLHEPHRRLRCPQHAASSRRSVALGRKRPPSLREPSARGSSPLTSREKNLTQNFGFAPVSGPSPTHRHQRRVGNRTTTGVGHRRHRPPRCPAGREHLRCRRPARAPVLRRDRARGSRQRAVSPRRRGY